MLMLQVRSIAGGLGMAMRMFCATFGHKTPIDLAVRRLLRRLVIMMTSAASMLAIVLTLGLRL